MDSDARVLSCVELRLSEGTSGDGGGGTKNEPEGGDDTDGNNATGVAFGGAGGKTNTSFVVPSTRG